MAVVEGTYMGGGVGNIESPPSLQFFLECKLYIVLQRIILAVIPLLAVVHLTNGLSMNATEPTATESFWDRWANHITGGLPN